MKTYKIAAISENKKNAYTAAGQRFFIPKHLQETAKVGDYMLTAEKSFTQRTNEAGDVVPCEPWTRTDVTFVGDKQAVLTASVEDQMLALEAQALVIGEHDKIATTYNISAEQLSKMGAL